MQSLEQHLTHINRSKAPPSQALQLKTQTRVWDIIVWDNLGNGARGVVWKATGYNWRKKIRWALKEYQNDNILKLDQNRDAKQIVEKNIDTHRKLIELGIPTLSFLRQIDDSRVFMNDLTENGQYWISGATAWDSNVVLPRVWLQRTPIIGHKFIKKQNLLIYNVVREKMQNLGKKLLSSGVKIKALDAYFIRIKKTNKPLIADDIEILIWDLDNVEIDGSGVWYLSEEPDYVAYRLISRLLQR